MFVFVYGDLTIGLCLYHSLIGITFFVFFKTLTHLRVCGGPIGHNKNSICNGTCGKVGTGRYGTVTV